MKRKAIISLCFGCMALGSAPAYAQNQTIKGNVVDQNGEPIIGASVKVVGACPVEKNSAFPSQERF